MKFHFTSGLGIYSLISINNQKTQKFGTILMTTRDHRLPDGLPHSLRILSFSSGGADSTIYKRSAEPLRRSWKHPSDSASSAPLTTSILPLQIYLHMECMLLRAVCLVADAVSQSRHQHH